MIVSLGVPVTTPQQNDQLKLSATTQESDCLTSYASYLKGLYMSMSHSHTSQHWTHLPRCEFIELAMIGDEVMRRGGPEEEMVRLAQLGKIEIIMNQKERVDLADIFFPLPSPPPPLPSPQPPSLVPQPPSLVPQPPSQLPQPLSPSPSPSSLPPLSDQMNQQSQAIPALSILPPLKHRITLIEGAPGGGKSTLALHICHSWVQDAIFMAKFDVVVLAYLRDQAVQNARTLADILPATQIDNAIGTADVATQIASSSGIRVLFIFDGWDEFPPELQNNSLVSTIIREPHKLCLQQSTVIVTTRPVASGNLLHIADQRVEILGFTPHQIREYIKRALRGDSTRTQKLFKHLDEHPVIEGYCYIPLHAAILVHIFLTMKEVLPTTRHELFCDLVLCCIVRELKTHKSDRNVEIEISSLNDLPDVIKSQLNDLCVLAHKGVMQEEVVFYRKHLQASGLPSNLPSLGLLQAVEGLTCFSKSLSYNFLHLSVQELLAAYKISQLDPGEQLEIFKNLFGSARFQPVLHSFCGFTKLENPAIQDYISTYLQENSSVDNLFPFLHCFFEAQKRILCHLVGHQFRKLTLNSDDLSPADHLAVGYFITSLLLTCATDDEPYDVQLELHNVNDHYLKLLIGEIVKYQKPITSTVSVKLVLTSFFMISVDQLALLFKQLSISKLSIRNDVHMANLQMSSHRDRSMLFATEIQKTNCYPSKLLLSNNHIQHYTMPEEAEHIFLSLQHSTTLVYLDLSNARIMAGINTAQALAEMLQVNKKLKYLNLSNNTAFGTEAQYIFIGLQHNTTLVHLDLAKIELECTVETITALNEMLRINKTLTYLNLSCNQVALNVFFGLQLNRTLVHLNLQSTGITSRITGEALMKMLQLNKALTHLNLSYNFLYDLGVQSIFEVLQHNKTLVHFNLQNTGIETSISRTAEALTKMLQFNKALRHLNLSYNSISDVGAQSIFKGLQHNNTLVQLNLHCNRISDEGAVHIARLLDTNCPLQTLNISGNRIGYKGLTCIAMSLESKFTNLIRLDITDHYNTLPAERIEAINRIRQQNGLPFITIA